MNIIFFDIDGVLNYYGAHAFVDWDIVDRLMKMANDTNSKLVMSSSWKDVLISPFMYHYTDKFQVTKLVDTLGDLYIGYTPDIAPDDRELEIQQWLDEHPETENFVILDDLPFNFAELFTDNFVQTTGFSNVGFSEENERMAREILSK